MINDKLDDPNDALSFSGVMLMPEQVAERVEGLLDKPKPVLTIPRWRGRFARFFDRHPQLSLRLTPLLMRDALRRQRAFKKKVESGKWPPKSPLRGPHDPGDDGRAGFHTARGPMGALRLAPLSGGVVAGENRQDAGAALDRAGGDRLAAAADPLGLVGPRARRRAARRSGSRGEPGRVISLEDNEYWYPRTRERLRRLGLGNVDLRLRAVEDVPDGGWRAAGCVLRPRRRRLPGGAGGHAGRCAQTGDEEGAARRVSSARRLGSARVRRGVRAACRLARSAVQRRSRTSGPKPARPESSNAHRLLGVQSPKILEAGNRRGPLRGPLLSEPVSRILSGAAIHLCGPPGPRRAGSTVLLGLAPGGVCHARQRHRGAGALLPHRFTLACARLTCGRAIGGLLSAALSRGFPRVGVTHRPCPVVSGLSSKTPFVSPRLPSSPHQGSPPARLRGAVSPSLRSAQRASGELGPAGLATCGLQLSVTHRALRPASSRQGLPGAEDRVFKRHLGRLEQARSLLRPRGAVTRPSGKPPRRGRAGARRGCESASCSCSPAAAGPDPSHGRSA